MNKTFLKIDVQLPSGYSTLKWVLQFGITVKNGSCAYVGWIPGLNFFTLFNLSGKSVLPSSGPGQWRCMAGRRPSPHPMSLSRGRAWGSGAVSRQAQPFLGSACQRLFPGASGWLTAPGRWRAGRELWRGRELGQKGCWDRNARGKPQLKLMEE